MSKRIYFDNAASTPVSKPVLKAMRPFCFEQYGNASSTHNFGQQASAAITKVRKLIAGYLYCEPEEIIFTSGATESSNTAIKGVVNFYKRKFVANGSDSKPHLIVSAIEHPSVLESALSLEGDGCELTIVKPGTDGIMSLDDIIKAIKDNTVLISLMLVNNETGLIQPAQALGKKLIELNKERKTRIYYHVDAVQGLGYINCRPDHLKVDLMSFSGHKIYGPKGIGFLYSRNKTPLLQLLNGGHQERRLRGGTVNCTGVVGMGMAVQLLMNHADNYHEKIKGVSNYIYIELSKVRNLRFNSNQEKSISNIINFAVDSIKASDLQMMLDMSGVATSMGAACAAGAAQASPVLRAMGQTEEEALAGLRISLGQQNTLKEAKYFVNKLNDIIIQLSNE